ncbi:MAG: MarR family winged helix-turn-helix transcriptional regulator [Arenicellales bacterium]|jgi:DNA-binding MarR family transcriptional regulator|nr:MarR family winged helix-turn-helix transcriptional regulator [Arenicellales bacterium]
MQAEKARPANGHYILTDQVGFLLRRAHQRASLIFKNEFDATSLTPQQFAVLAKLYDISEVTQNNLGRLVDMDPVSLQGVIRRLSQRALVSRTSDPLHKRRLIIRLTPAGNAMVEDCFVLGTQVSTKTLAPLASEEQQELIRLLKKITDESA